jgi:hypothetical protein
MSFIAAFSPRHSYLRVLTREERRTQKKLLDLFLQPALQATSLLKLAHAVVPSRHDATVMAPYLALPHALARCL